MPIKITKFQETPAVQYDHLHMVECSIRLATTDEAKTEIKAIFHPYGYNEGGDKVFAPSGEITVFEKDFLTLAMTEAAQGDPTYLQAFALIEAAIAKMLGDKMPSVVGTASQSF